MSDGLNAHKAKKRCSKCGVQKLLDDFSRKADGRDELRSVCRTCDSDSQREYYQVYRDEILDRKRRYYEEHREALLESKRRHREAMRDMTRETATRNGEPYTPAEDAHILTSDEPLAVIAVEIGRTMSSVNHRRCKLRKAATA